MHETLRNAVTGSLVGVVWEGIGEVFLWELAEPKSMLFILAIISWGILGILIGYILHVAAYKTDYKFIVKLAIGLCGLVAGKITMELGLISYGDIGPRIAGVPIVMVMGLLTLAYVIDYLGSPEKAVRRG